MDAIELLAGQHRRAEAIFERLRSAHFDEREALVSELADALAVHAEIEERVFYPALRSAGLHELVDEASDEHRDVKLRLAELLDLERDDPDFPKLVEQLDAYVKEHVEREERDVFPRALTALSTRRIEGLGLSLQELDEELRQEGRPGERLVEDSRPVEPL